MLKSIKTYLAKLLWGGHDDERQHETATQDAARMLEMDEPMAGAGAQLAGMHHTSETEEALKRASSRAKE
jgi:hypothetical protein